jgi:transcriptional regulator with AAA-type ATPase domain
MAELFSWMDHGDDGGISGQAAAALQEHRITRVGSNQEIKLDVRVIASSNRNVADEVAAGRFREISIFV